jgi:hypothetical protein
MTIVSYGWDLLQFLCWIIAALGFALYTSWSEDDHG